MTRTVKMAAVLLAAFLYAVVTPLVKLAATAQVSIAWLTVFQYPMALGFFAVPLLWRRHRTRPPLLLSALVGVALAGTALAYYQALRALPAWLAVLLLFQFSWMLPLIGWAGGQGRPTRRQWTAIAAILAGTLLAVGIAHPVRWPWVGMSLGLAAGLAYALTLYGQGRLPPETPPGPPSLISSLVAGVIVLTAYHPWAGSAISLSWRAVLYGSLAGLFSTALPLVLVYRAARSLGSALTAILASLELPAAVVLSRIWLGERVTPTRWLGVAVMLAAIIYGAWPKPPPELELE